MEEQENLELSDAHLDDDGVLAAADDPSDDAHDANDATDAEQETRGSKLATASTTVVTPPLAATAPPPTVVEATPTTTAAPPPTPPAVAPPQSDRPWLWQESVDGIRSLRASSARKLGECMANHILENKKFATHPDDASLKRALNDAIPNATVMRCIRAINNATADEHVLVNRMCTYVVRAGFADHAQQQLRKQKKQQRRERGSEEKDNQEVAVLAWMFNHCDEGSEKSFEFACLFALFALFLHGGNSVRRLGVIESIIPALKLMGFGVDYTYTDEVFSPLLIEFGVKAAKKRRAAPKAPAKKKKKK